MSYNQERPYMNKEKEWRVYFSGTSTGLDSRAEVVNFIATVIQSNNSLTNIKQHGRNISFKSGAVLMRDAGLKVAPRDPSN